MNKTAVLLVAAALCGASLAQDANKTPAVANGKTVTITGTIKNFEEFKAAVVPGTTTNAAFSFHVSNLPPGRYFIGAQKLKSATYGRIPNGFLINEQRVFIVVVNADDKSPHTIDAGDLIVWTH